MPKPTAEDLAGDMPVVAGISKTCMTCANWKHGIDDPDEERGTYRYCYSRHFRHAGSELQELDCCMIHDDTDHGVIHFTGKDFGCVHWSTVPDDE